METLADVDDDFAEVYLENDEVPEEAIHVGALGFGLGGSWKPLWGR